MFIAMNRFRIVKGREAEFERIWKERDSHLEDVPGFEEFHLLRGPEADDHTLRLPYGLAKPAAFRGLDEVRGLPQGPRQCRRRQGRLSGPPHVRRVRDRALRNEAHDELESGNDPLPAIRFLVQFHVRRRSAA